MDNCNCPVSSVQCPSVHQLTVHPAPSVGQSRSPLDELLDPEACVRSSDARRQGTVSTPARPGPVPARGPRRDPMRHGACMESLGISSVNGRCLLARRECTWMDSCINPSRFPFCSTCSFSPFYLIHWSLNCPSVQCRVQSVSVIGRDPTSGHAVADPVLYMYMNCSKLSPFLHIDYTP